MRRQKSKKHQPLCHRAASHRCSCPSEKRIHLTTLDQIQEGESIEVCSVRGTGTVADELIAMGFVTGTYAEVLRNKADTGCIVKIGTKRITIRHEQAEQVWVLPTVIDM